MPLSDIPYDNIHYIFEFMHPHGEWKYTCKMTHKIAVDRMVKMKMFGDDAYTDRIVVGKIFRKYHTDSALLKYQLKNTDRDFHFRNIVEQVYQDAKEINERHERIVLGALATNKKVSEECRMRLFVRNVVTIKKVDSHMFFKFLENGHTKIASYIIFDTNWLMGFTNFHIKDIIRRCAEFVDDNLSARKMYILAKNHFVGDALEFFTRIPYHDIIVPSDSAEHICEFVNIGRRYQSVDTQSHIIPADLDILSKLFNYVGEDTAMIYILNWRRRDIIKLVCDNPHMMPGNLTAAIETFIKLEKAELAIYRQSSIWVNYHSISVNQREKIILDTYEREYYMKFIDVSVMQIVTKLTDDERLLKNVYRHSLRNHTNAGMKELSLLCRSRLPCYKMVEEDELKCENCEGVAAYIKSLNEMREH